MTLYRVTALPLNTRYPYVWFHEVEETLTTCAEQSSESVGHAIAWRSSCTSSGSQGSVFVLPAVPLFFIIYNPLISSSLSPLLVEPLVIC